MFSYAAPRKGIFVLSVLVCTFWGISVSAQSRDFIESFDSSIEVRSDGSLRIRETIEQVFAEERHGFSRCLPRLLKEKASSPLHERYADINVIDVAKDGTKIPYVVHDRRDDVCVQIGDPEKKITGAHTYTILYEVYGSITYEENGGADLYYSVTGHGWAVPIKKTTVTILSDTDLLEPEHACYRGKADKTDSCKQIESKEGAVVFSDGFLFPYEGVTIVQALDRSKILKDVRERYVGSFVATVFLVLGLIVCGAIIYRFKIRYKGEKAIVAQYGPYDLVKPMYVGYLFDLKLNARDIAAGILYLAQSGYIQIREKAQNVVSDTPVIDYEFLLIKPDIDPQNEFERSLLALFFKPDAVVGTTVQLNDVQNELKNVLENTKQLKDLRKALKNDLQSRGFFTSAQLVSIPIQIAITLTIFMGGVLSVLINELFITICIATGIITVVSLTVLLVYASGCRTRKGTDARSHLLGFKNYLQVTNKERFVFHNAPKHNATSYLEHLPYAVAFGVEKEWSKTYDGIIASIPSWYVTKQGGSFSFIRLTQELDAFTRTLTTEK